MCELPDEAHVDGETELFGLLIERDVEARPQSALEPGYISEVVRALLEDNSLVVLVGIHRAVLSVSVSKAWR